MFLKHIKQITSNCLIFAGHCSCPTSCDSASVGEPGTSTYLQDDIFMSLLLPQTTTTV